MKQDGSHSGTPFTIVGTNTALQTNETRLECMVTFWHSYYHSLDSKVMKQDENVWSHSGTPITIVWTQK